MTSPRFGLIGSGFIGRAHAIALHEVGAVFGEEYSPHCELLADRTSELARRSAAALGFSRGTGDWRALIADPQVDVVDICAPNYLHREMALAALAAGKHVYCEKPLANTAADAREIADAAVRSGRIHLTGFNYICNPMLQLARQMIESGELGDVYEFRGCYLEDYMSDPAQPWTWRCARALAGTGALADLGSHLINLGHFLLGDIQRVCGSLRTVHGHRPDPGTGSMRAVENEDLAQVLVEFARGANGTFEISRIATGFKCGLRFVAVGTKGTLAFDQERMNELRHFDASGAPGRHGFRTILAGPEHPDYRAFCPAAGHGLGYNDLKVIEIRNLLRAIRNGGAAWPDFVEGWRVQRVIDAIVQADTVRGWVEVGA